MRIQSLTPTRALAQGNMTSSAIDKLSQCPSRYKWVNRDFYFEPTAANIEYINSNFPTAEWDDELSRRLEEILSLRKHEEGKQIVIEDDGWKFETSPYDHQREAFYLSRDRKVYALLMEMGTGKTWVGINTIAYLYMNGLIDKILILAPNGVHKQWITEQLPQHLRKDIEYASTWYESSKSKATLKRLEEVKKFKGLQIISQHIESLSHSSGLEFAEGFCSSGSVMIVLDESSKIKNQGSTRTKNICKLKKLSTYRRIMSGTPITKGVEDLYSQFMFLDENILGYSSFYSFRARYCILGGFQQKNIVGYKNLGELQRRIDGHSYRKTKDECLSLPERVYVNRYVELTPEQEEKYKDIRDRFLYDLPAGGSIDLNLAIVRITKLQQVLSGFFTDTENQQTFTFPSNKLDALIDVLEESGDSKVIVWGKFRQDIDLISERLRKEKIGFVTYTGATTTEDRTKAIEQFREDPSIKVFLGNPSAAGIGLNLTVANVMVWYSLTYDLDVYLQAQDRCHRIGQDKKVTYVFLVSPKTIDIKIAKSLSQKKGIADMVLDIRDMLD